MLAGCNCVAVNTVKGSVNDCNNSTGVCNCKRRGTAVLGVRCENCVIGNYMRPDHGCVACDKCPTDQRTVNKSCYYCEYCILLILSAVHVKV